MGEPIQARKREAATGTGGKQRLTGAGTGVECGAQGSREMEVTGSGRGPLALEIVMRSASVTCIILPFWWKHKAPS